MAEVTDGHVRHNDAFGDRQGFRRKSFKGVGRPVGAAGWVLEDTTVVDTHHLVPVTLAALWTQQRCSLAPG